MDKNQTDKTRRGLYAKIAIARKQLPDMDEEAYRALLEQEFGKRSSADLSTPQLARLVQQFARLGVTYTAPAKANNKAVKPHSREDWVEITDSMPFAREKRQIAAIWRKLGYSLNSLDTRVRREFGSSRFVWMQDGKHISILLSDLQKREKAFDRKKALQNAEGTQGASA